MMRSIALALVLLVAPFGVQAGVPTCSATSDFVISAEQLPATRRAIQRGSLSILALGGTATAGLAAKDESYTYPARLVARLQEQLPGVQVRMTVRAVPRRATAEALGMLNANLASSQAALVIWGPGGSAAARGEDVHAFGETVQDVISRTRTSGVDLILMTLQYAPSVARIVNLAPYRAAVLNAGEMEARPVFDRYEFMRQWNASGLVNLDSTEPARQVAVARKVFDCMAEALAHGIVHAVR